MSMRACAYLQLTHILTTCLRARVCAVCSEVSRVLEVMFREANGERGEGEGVSGRTYVSDALLHLMESKRG